MISWASRPTDIMTGVIDDPQVKPSYLIALCVARPVDLSTNGAAVLMKPFILVYG